MPELVEHADGVYIGLPAAPYQADWALGSSSIKALAINPLDWWWHSPFNLIEPPPIDEEEAKHFRLGTAVHVALLEGTRGDLDTYEATYGIMPNRETHPDALVTAQDIGAQLRRLHLSHTAPTKDDLIRRLLSVEPGAQILDVLQEEWRLSGRRGVTLAEDRRIRLIHGIANASREEFVLPDGEMQTLREAFIGGLAEVSVFWTDENGIRQRARFDKLKAMVTIDLKTFANWKKNVDFHKSLLVEVKNRGYVLQAVHYQEARRQMRRLVDEGLVYGGTPEQRSLLEDICTHDSWAWLWVFAVTQGYPHVKGVRPELGGIEFGRAEQDRETALTKFVLYRERFGLKSMWLDVNPIWEPEEQDWPFA